MLLWGWKRALATFGAGAVATLAQPPWDFFAAAFVAFPLLVWLLDGAAGTGRFGRLAPAFGTGWLFGFGYFVAGLWWIGDALLVEADQFAWALPLVVIALPALLAVFFGLATAAASLCWRHELGRLAALAAAFGAAEWMRALVLTGFPWNMVGQMAMPTPLLMQSTAIVGPFGMNALAVLLFSLPALLSGRRHRVRGLVLGVLLVGLHVGFGVVRLGLPEESGDRLAVRIVQPSASLAGAWTNADRDAMFARLVDLSRRPAEPGGRPPELIVWPETAVPFLFTERPQALAEIGALLTDGQMLMTGAVRAEAASGGESLPIFYNSLLVIGADGTIIDAADKVHLVPFGEYLPFPGILRSLGVDELVTTLGGYSAAPARKLVSGPRGLRFLPLICYEAIFPGEVDRDAIGADLLINLTVDTWFGDTPGPWQHLRQAQLRAVETGLPMIRAGNSGITAIIDSRGRIRDALALDAVGTLDGEVPLAMTERLKTNFQSALSIAILIALTCVACVMNTRLDERSI